MTSCVYRARRACRAYCLCGSALFALLTANGATSAQTQLPEVVVAGAKPKPKPRKTPQHSPAPPTAPVTPAAQLNAKADAFDQSRSNLYTTIGTTSDTLTHNTVNASRTASPMKTTSGASMPRSASSKV